jgi:hypothetical protein
MPSEKQSHWISNNAERLGELQSSSSHLPPAKRRDYLRGELLKAVQSLPAGERPGQLESLASHFPVEGASLPECSSPQQTLDELRRHLATLAGHELHSFGAAARTLLDAAVPAKPQPPAGGGDLHGLLRYDAENLPNLQLALTVLKSGKLQSTTPGALELLNLIKTAALLIETFGGIESVFWKIWSAAAPKSPVQDPFADGFITETARLLEGKPGASFASYSRSVAQSGQLLVALLSAIPTALDRMAGAWLDQFAPERIAADVRRSERGPLGGQPEQRFWREYEYRSADFTPARLAESFFRHLSESASSMIQSQTGTSS